MMDRWLMSLTDMDISTALAAVHDRRLQEILLEQGSELIALANDIMLTKQAFHLVASGFDRVLAELSWNGG